MVLMAIMSEFDEFYQPSEMPNTDSAYWMIWSNFLKWLKCLKLPHKADIYQFNEMFIIVSAPYVYAYFPQ